MNKHTVTLFLLFLALSGCIKQQVENKRAREAFSIPVVFQDFSRDSLKRFKAGSLSEVVFKFFGKYKFTDTLRVGKQCHYDSTWCDDLICENMLSESDYTLARDGFQIIADYKTDILFVTWYKPEANNYFPVYVVNETSRTKLFNGKDSNVFGIQEARDSSSSGWWSWHPIECRFSDFCGNGNFDLRVHPGEFVVFLVPKYEGHQKRQMRVRLEIGESIFISQPYEGTLSLSQFEIMKNSWEYESLQDDKWRTIYGMYFGSTPKGFD